MTTAASKSPVPKPKSRRQSKIDLNELRYADLSIADFAKQVEEIGSIYRELSAILASAKQLGIRSIRIDGATKLPRSIAVGRESVVCMDVALTKARQSKKRDT